MVTNPPPPENILHDSNARYVEPQVTVSQGNPTTGVAGGQVTIVYDDYGTEEAHKLDQIDVQTNTLGGTSAQFSSPAGDLGINTFASVNSVVVAENFFTPIPVNVNITDPKFTSLEDFKRQHVDRIRHQRGPGSGPDPPAAINTYLTSKIPNYPGAIILYDGDQTGANLGISADGNALGTTFDPTAIRSVSDGNTNGIAVGHFRPSEFSDGTEVMEALEGLSANSKVVNGKTLPGLNGTWDFEAGFSPAYTGTTTRYVNTVTLNFSSGNNPGSVVGENGDEVTVAGLDTTFVLPDPSIDPTNPAASNGAFGYNFPQDQVGGTAVSANPATPTTAPTQGTIPILPAPVITSDNTLGSFSEHEGRIYVAFTGMLTGAEDDANGVDTDIFMAWSDDGGQTWESSFGDGTAEQVNDDNAATDGSSGSTKTGLGRTQYEPQIAVDPSTGDLVVTYFDARNDPSDARVVTSVAVSNDGGNTFAASVYANPTLTATDAVTGNAVSQGPIPDNQSTTSGAQDTDAFGAHQALIVANGVIIPFWASNQNAINTKLGIVDAILSLAAGPRIISSTEGPVGGTVDTTNTARAADGTSLANTITVTFDQGVDPTTFLPANVEVFYKAPTGGASVSLPVSTVTPVAGTRRARLRVHDQLQPGQPGGDQLRRHL